MKRYTDLFVDFDDTLYDTHGNAVIALEELYETMHLERHFSSPEVFYNEYWLTNIDLWGRYAQGEITRDYLIVERFRRPLSLGHDLKVSEDYCRRMSDVFLDYCSNKPGLVDGAREAVDYLLHRGYRLHMCSNGFREVQYKKLRACGLDVCFTTVILSEDAGYNKPAAGFFDYAFRQTGAQRETTVMIGDNYSTDIVGARTAGLDTIFFNRYPDYPAEGPVTYEISSLTQLKEILL